MSVEDEKARKELLAAAWSDAAVGYARYFVPRFAPWTEEALAALAARSDELPAGPVLVPCCGPGHELLLAAERLPGREVLGSDLSPGMVELAREKVAGRRLVSVEQADACALDAKHARRAAAILSSFGLQQLPDPAAAIASWARCLAGKGVLSVVFWPPRSRDDGPFDAVRALVAARVPQPDTSWENALVPALERAGARVLEDRVLAHTMRHASAGTFFDELARSGPLRSLAISKGEGFMAELRSAFLAKMPPGPIAHSPRARLLVAQPAQ